MAAEPWAGLVRDARRAGARIIEFSRELVSGTDLFDERIAGPLAESVPAYVKRLIAET